MQDSQHDSSKKYEFEGANLEEALHRASERLGIPEPELDYEIVEQGRRGLFGLGAKNVRIRVMPPLDDVLPDPDKRRRRGRPRRERRPSAKATADKQGSDGQAASRAAGDPDAPTQARAEAAPEGEEQPRRRRKSRNRRRRERTRRQRDADGAPSEGGAEAAAARRPRSGRPSKRNEARRGPRSKKASAEGGGSEAASRRAETPPADPEQVAAVQSTLQQMIDLMGLELTATPGTGAGGVRLQLDGPDRKALVRRDAELLSALQFVLNRMSRRAWPGAGRIRLTCNGQRSRRDEDVGGIVEQAIQQVLRTGEPQQLREMNAYERRLVHIAVRQVRGVRSSSEGEGHLKRVRIVKLESAEMEEVPPSEPATPAEPGEVDAPGPREEPRGPALDEPHAE